MKARFVLGMVLVVLLAGGVWGQRDFSKVEIRSTKLSDTLYMLEGSGGNIAASIGEDGVLIVDDQFAPLADKIKAAIGELGGTTPAFVLNTHHHGDHTGGNAIFGEDAVIVTHDNVRKRLLDRRVDDAPLPKSALPEVTYDQGLSLHFNGETISVVHFPGSHTDGDGVVFFKGSKVVHTGDLFFKDRFPYVDLNSGGKVQGLIRSITKLTEMIPADWKIVPGHGSLATHADLTRYLRMLVITSTIVQDRIAAGQTLEQCQAAGVPEEYADWGGGFINNNRWISILYNSYAKG